MANGAALSGGRLANAVFISVPAQESASAVIFVSRPKDSLLDTPRFWSMGCRDVAADVDMQNCCGTWASGVNVTRMDVVGSRANSMADGTRIQLFEVQ